MIAIVDYGMGNLRNVGRAFAELGHAASVTDQPEAIVSARAVVLPGVGAFGEAVRRIDRLGLRKPILDAIKLGRPLLGICLGMQLLYEESEESPGFFGLGVLPGTVRRFENELKVPHIGWNDVITEKATAMFGVPGRAGCFYFVHSYFAPLSEFTIGQTEYGISFSAAVRRGNIYGVQFHPEKSQEAGMNVLDRFARLT